jgi:hypothetical protein
VRCNWNELRTPHSLYLLLTYSSGRRCPWGCLFYSSSGIWTLTFILQILQTGCRGAATRWWSFRWDSSECYNLSPVLNDDNSSGPTTATSIASRPTHSLARSKSNEVVSTALSRRWLHSLQQRWCQWTRRPVTEFCNLDLWGTYVCHLRYLTVGVLIHFRQGLHSSMGTLYTPSLGFTSNLLHMIIREAPEDEDESYCSHDTSSTNISVTDEELAFLGAPWARPRKRCFDVNNAIGSPQEMRSESLVAGIYWCRRWRALIHTSYKTCITYLANAKEF